MKTAGMTEAEADARHAEKMANKKAARDRMLATKTIEKGLLIVHTGKGKGKTSAALGMVVRAIGHGMKVGVVQFVKGAMKTGEKAVFDAFPDNVEFKPMGEGFTWDTQDRTRDIAAARAGWDEVNDALRVYTVFGIEGDNPADAERQGQGFVSHDAGKSWERFDHRSGDRHVYGLVSNHEDGGWRGTLAGVVQS